MHHDTWKELGSSGKKVKIPIKILPKPISIKSEVWKRPENWKPQENGVSELLVDVDDEVMAEEVENY